MAGQSHRRWRLSGHRKAPTDVVYPVLEHMNRVMVNPATGETLQSVDVAVATEN